MPGLIASPIQIQARTGKAVALPYLSKKIIYLMDKYSKSSEIQELSNREHQKIVIKFDDMWEWQVYTPGCHLRDVLENEVPNDKGPDYLYNI